MTATYQSDPVKDADEKIQSVWLLSTAQLAIELQLSAPAAYPTALAWLKSASDAEALSSVNEALSRPETQLGERNTPIMIGSGEVKKLWYAIVCMYQTVKVSYHISINCRGDVARLRHGICHAFHRAVSYVEVAMIGTNDQPCWLADLEACKASPTCKARAHSMLHM